MKDGQKQRDFFDIDETESEMEDPEVLISQLERDPSSNMVQAIYNGELKPKHSLFELKLQMLISKQTADQSATTLKAPQSGSHASLVLVNNDQKQ